MLRIVILLSLLVISTPGLSNTPLDSSLQDVKYDIYEKSSSFKKTTDEFIYWPIDDKLQLEISKFEHKPSIFGGVLDPRLDRWWDTFSKFEKYSRAKAVYNAPSINFKPLIFFYNGAQDSKYTDIKINGVEVSLLSFYTSEFSDYINRDSIQYALLEDNIKQNKPIEITYTKLIGVNDELGSPAIEVSVKKYLLVDGLNERYEGDLKSSQADLKKAMMPVKNVRDMAYKDAKRFYYLFYAFVFIVLVIGIILLNYVKNWIAVSIDPKMAPHFKKRRRSRRRRSKSASTREILELGELRNKNIISESEFNEKKSQISDGK